MPQMAPMSWMFLFLSFILMLLMIMTTNYYLYNPMISSTDQKTKMIAKMVWKW